MIRMSNILYLIIFSIIFMACAKEKFPNISCSAKSNSIEIVKKLLPGSYSWAYTVATYQLGGSKVETPLTRGLNYRYVFQKNGLVKFFENGKLKSTDVYKIDYEFKVTTYPSDSAVIVIISNTRSGQRKSFFRPYLCNDSALFYNPYNSIDFKDYFKRN